MSELQTPASARTSWNNLAANGRTDGRPAILGSVEAGARQTYESLIKACDDEGTKKTLHHLLTREITHADMFMKALDAMGKLDDPFFGNIPPDETVKLVFNLSQDEDVRGPWNEEPDFDYVADPQPEGGRPPPPINADDEGHDSRSSKPRKRRAGAALPA
jgi:Mn-containing catalase